MKIAICEEEKRVCGQIEGIIQQLLCGCAPDCYETGAVLLFSGKEYDLIFLDIGKDGRKGLETAQKLRNRQEDVLLVFITEQKEFVFDALDVEAFHYLLKPLDEEKLKDVVRRAAHHVQKKNPQECRRLIVRTRNRNAAIPIREILYIENQKRKAEIHTLHGSIELYATMKELEAQLDGRFYRCHRGYLVNMAYIAEYRSDCIFLQNGETVYLSKERYPEFVKTYMNYLENRE